MTTEDTAKQNETISDTKGTAQATQVDFTKVGDEDFQKVFDDPRLWKHPRFKELNERSKQAKELEAKQLEAEKAILAEQGKYKELSELRTKELENYKAKYNQSRLDNKLIAEAQKLGAVDVEAVLKLVDRSNIKIDDETVSGYEEALASLAQAKTYLFGKKDVTIGTGTNPSGVQGTTKRFKHSQLKDAKFFKENEKDIMVAMKLGLIEEDIK